MPDPELPDPADPAEAADAAPPEPVAEAPLNRAERRGRKRQAPLPGHVGPRAEHTPAGRAPRAHTKRRSG